jgi:hypothetical protein
MTPTLDKEDEIAKWASQKNASVSKKPKLLEAGHPDNFQTPGSAIECLLPYLPKEWLIWEPACGKGNLVRAFERQGYKVYGSDITEPYGKDFLHVDCKVSAIITNPPFSIKEKFLAPMLRTRLSVRIVHADHDVRQPGAPETFPPQGHPAHPAGRTHQLRDAQRQRIEFVVLLCMVHQWT